MERSRAGWSGMVSALLCGNGSTTRCCARFASWRSPVRSRHAPLEEGLETGSFQMLKSTRLVGVRASGRVSRAELVATERVKPWTRSATSTANTPGIRTRHSRTCRTRGGRRCSGEPTFEAWLYSKREGKKNRKTFTTLAAARGWRTSAAKQVKDKRLRAPSSRTLRQEVEDWLAGARSGEIRNKLRCQIRHQMRVRMRVQVRLRTARTTPVRCSHDSRYLQRISLPRNASQLVRADF
jgi:hypothetical protein